MTHLKKALVATLLFFTIVAMLFSTVPSVSAFSYQDSLLSYLSVTSSQDTAKPSSVISATVMGMLASTVPNGESIVFHIAFSVDTFSQAPKTLTEQDLVINSKTTFRSSVAQIVIPSDALNGAYIYASITNGTITFSKIPIAVVQSPLYSELQTQVNSLNTSLISQQYNNTVLANKNTELQNQLDQLQTDFDSLLSNCTFLQGNLSVLTTQFDGLKANNTALQTQLATLLTEKAALQTQLSTLQASSRTLQVQLDAAIANNTLLASQIASLQANNTDLMNQTITLQTQLNTLQSNNQQLQTTINNLTNETSTLQQQLVDLQLTSNALQKKNANISMLMYVATGIAAAFVAATAYIVLFVVRGKGSKEKSLF
jgi:predicted nuclease with TOPRIM domain